MGWRRGAPRESGAPSRLSSSAPVVDRPRRHDHSVCRKCCGSTLQFHPSGALPSAVGGGVPDSGSGPLVRRPNCIMPVHPAVVHGLRSPRAGIITVVLRGTRAALQRVQSASRTPGLRPGSATPPPVTPAAPRAFHPSSNSPWRLRRSREPHVKKAAGHHDSEREERARPTGPAALVAAVPAWRTRRRW